MLEKYWIWGIFALGVGLTVIRLAVTLIPAAEGESEEDALRRERAWTAVRFALQRFMMAALFLPAGVMLVMGMGLAPEADLTKGVQVFGALILVFGAYMLMSGGSYLLTAYGLFRASRTGDSAP